ncbi:FadR/GntR family transcriptional regulator [Achromobacter dolens]|jgi:DNA-binding FadR family transcriptional regulator|uniref:FadR/GntR family transcriptional regulator n=1 Tax=Achromobacter dolens TaxID=1287738 RepID=UPI0006C20F66|nr:FadR/GntR family transcriptional regulator [Achromobacter dolens]MCZ8408508.1 FadR/GntR family transcriptional regulator [Achromobacter dolens]CAB3847127.1 Putative L-lactate dehydrogenase operon regulatory protein [Achromobacter dolens]CUJ71326.1 L-lactate utilization operon repressor [Achromobacter dolens]
MNTFQAVAVTRLYRMIADQIAGRIRAGDFPRGGRLPSERELAEQLQVSRASIREALIALEIEGYVEVRVGTGVFVTASRESAALPAMAGQAAAQQDDIGPFDLLEARMLIEPECAALAAQQGSAAQLAAIRGAHEAMSLTDAPGWHDREFHGAIAAACGNAALAASVAHLWNLSLASPVFSRMQDYFVNTKVWAVAHAEHQRILTAILARDPIRARHAMHAHLIGILARLREDFGDDDGSIRPDI